MLLEADSVSKGFTADFARVGSCPTVRSTDVNLQPVWSRKHLREEKDNETIRIWEHRGFCDLYSGVEYVSTADCKALLHNSLTR